MPTRAPRRGKGTARGRSGPGGRSPLEDALLVRRAALVLVALAAVLAVLGHTPAGGDGTPWDEEQDPGRLDLQCNIKVWDATEWNHSLIVAAISESPLEPLMFRGACAAWAARERWRDRDGFLETFGAVPVGVGVGRIISQMPQKNGLLASWRSKSSSSKHIRKEGPDARALRASFKRAVERNESPLLRIDKLVRLIRARTLPFDAYTFMPVDDNPDLQTLKQSVPEMHVLWKALAAVLYSRTAKIIDGTLIGIGGAGSGVVFHAHEFGLTAVFVGHKRWFMYARRDLEETFLVKLLSKFSGVRSMAEWVEVIYPYKPFAKKWAKIGKECLQGPGDILYVPRGYLHATLNLDETLSMTDQGTRLQESDKARAAGLI